jgi:hypothetical protein
MLSTNSHTAASDRSDAPSAGFLSCVRERDACGMPNIVLDTQRESLRACIIQHGDTRWSIGVRMNASKHACILVDSLLPACLIAEK